MRQGDRERAVQRRASDARRVAARRQEKLAPEGAPRQQRWWLADAAGGEVLAAVGEEREARDGHYAYRAAPAFAAARPLAAGNMAAVGAWLEQARRPPGVWGPGRRASFLSVTCRLRVKRMYQEWQRARAAPDGTRAAQMLVRPARADGGASASAGVPPRRGACLRLTPCPLFMAQRLLTSGGLQVSQLRAACRRGGRAVGRIRRRHTP